MIHVEMVRMREIEKVRNVFMDMLGDKITEGSWRFLMVKNFSWYEILNSSKFLMMPKNGQ
jgi:hypothetical protein